MTPVRDMSVVRTVVLRREREVRAMLDEGHDVGEVAREFNMSVEEVVEFMDDDQYAEYLDQSPISYPTSGFRGMDR